MKALAEVHYRLGNYANAEPLYREAIASITTSKPDAIVEIADWKASLARVLADWAWSEHGPGSDSKNRRPEIAERAREAESLLRDSLAIRLSGSDPTHWRATGEIPSRLGSALVAIAATDPDLTSEARLAKFAEAESLMLPANEVVQHTENVANRYKQASLIRLVRLYEAWKKPVKAAEWRTKLAAFENATTEKKPAPDDETRKAEQDASRSP